MLKQISEETKLLLLNKYQFEVSSELNDWLVTDPNTLNYQLEDFPVRLVHAIQVEAFIRIERDILKSLLEETLMLTPSPTGKPWRVDDLKGRILRDDDYLRLLLDLRIADSIVEGLKGKQPILCVMARRYSESDAELTVSRRK